MAYTITKTDGTTLLTLSDSRVDQISTSLALIGKNVESYGQYYNNNLVGLLENFASADQPRSPVTGQLWYNKVDGRMYVYGLDNVFKPVAGASVSNTQPLNSNAGDFWIDTTNKQLWFTTDGANFILAGPQYSEIEGKSGWIVETIVDSAKNNQIVASLYNNNTLLGIAATTAFVFDVPFNGMTSVQPGFNLNQNIPGVRFIGTATSADSVQGFTPGDYLTKTGDQIIQGGLSVLDSDPGLFVGINQDLQFQTDDVFTNIYHNIADKSLRIRGISSLDSITAYFTGITVDSANKRVGILTETPAYTFDVLGSARIQGNLIVEGTATNISSVNLQVSDKNIELAYSLTPSDTLANGGGIVLLGSTNHTLTWANNGTGWNSNDNFNLTSTATSFMIGGNTVITATSIGSVITTAPGIRRVGVLDLLTVTNVVISGNTVSATGTNQTLFLTGTGSGTVDVRNNRITNLATPTADFNAATKKYVDDALLLVGTKGFAFTVDTTGMNNPDLDIIPYLNAVLPVTNLPGFEYLDLVVGTRIRVLCQETSMSIPASPAQLVNLNYNTVQVTDINSQTQTVITQGGLTGVIPSTTQINVSVSRTVRQYIVNSSSEWEYDGVIPV